MRKIILLAVLSVIILGSARAQDYNTGIGLRGGLSSGITVRHFIGENTALEGLFTLKHGGFLVTGLYEIQDVAFDTPRLNWYYGFGAHLGIYDGNNKRYDDGDEHLNLGIDGIIGIEYNFEEVPINLSIDWKPSIDLFGDSDYFVDEAALSIRYIF